MISKFSKWQLVLTNVQSNIRPLLVIAVVSLTVFGISRLHYESSQLTTANAITACLLDDPSEDIITGLKNVHMSATNPRKRRDIPSRFSVDTYFHIVLAEGEREKKIITDEMVTKQVRFWTRT